MVDDGRTQVERLADVFRHGDIEEVVDAMEKITQFINTYLTVAVERLQTEPCRDAIVERLVFLGTAIVPHLLPLLDAENPEVSESAALALLHVGDESGVSLLLDILASVDAERGSFIAMKLGSRGVQQACPLLLKHLDTVPDDNAGLVNTYLSALSKLGCDLPPHLVERFSRPALPPGIIRLFDPEPD